MKPKQILDFIHYAEGLKKVLRHEWLSNGEQVDVAEHCWRASLLLLLLYPYLEHKVDLLKCLKMIVIHDINEVTVGDTPAFLRPYKEEQCKLERKNMEDLKQKYNSPLMDEFFNLWDEYEQLKTKEAKFVRAVDKLEAWIQHNESDIKTWNDIEYPRSQYIHNEYCKHDKFLTLFKNLVSAESKQKILDESDKDFEDIKRQVKAFTEDN